jgi:hypothetical protein
MYCGIFINLGFLHQSIDTIELILGHFMVYRVFLGSHFPGNLVPFLLPTSLASTLMAATRLPFHYYFPLTDHSTTPNAFRSSFLQYVFTCVFYKRFCCAYSVPERLRVVQ